MNTVDFPGQHKLISQLDAAVALGDDRKITDALRKSLCQLIRDPDIELPECVLKPIDDHYARRELYVSPEYGYSVVAMTWAPGQGTKVHDHSGMWCVEGVWHGSLEITQYELADADREHDRFRFVEAGTIEAGVGSAGSLIPPHEYHTIRNPSQDAVAVSLHVYQRSMVKCSVFSQEAEDAEWMQRGERLLGTDQVH